MGWLGGQVALITGGGSGIGRAVVERFIHEGASVGVLERDKDAAEELRDEFGKAVCVTLGDVTSPKDNFAAVSNTVQSFGQLNSFVGNAGIWDYMLPLQNMEMEKIPEIFTETFSINVMGYLLGAKAAAPELLKSKGNIILTVSNSGFFPGGGGSIYTSSKYAVVGLIKQLAFELAPDIRVNGVAPGGTLTSLRGSQAAEQDKLSINQMPGVEEDMARISPLGLAAKPQDHAAHYVLLASNENSPATTATIIHSDGGVEIRGRSDAPPV